MVSVRRCRCSRCAFSRSSCSEARSSGAELCSVQSAAHMAIFSGHYHHRVSPSPLFWTGSPHVLSPHVGIASEKGLVTGGLPPSFPELASYKCRQSCLDIPQPSAPSCITLQRTSPAKMFSKLAVLVLVAVPAAFSVTVRQAVDFVNPANGGGSMLIDAGNGLGEPLNVRFAMPPYHRSVSRKLYPRRSSSLG